MKFTANSTELQRTLIKIGGVIPSKSALQILEHILFDLSKNTLTLTGSDMSVSLTISQQVHGFEDGKIALPAKLLLDTMKSLPDTQITFHVDTAASKVRISTDNGEYTMTGMGAKEYPLNTTFQEESHTALESGTLRRIIQHTLFAVSIDELRPAMMGVLLHMGGQEVRAVATDGHRLVKYSLRGEKSASVKKEVVVPAKSLAVLSKVLEEKECTVTFSQQHIRFSFGETHLESRLIEEKYPNYQAVIPAENDKKIGVRREELIAATRRVALYANPSTRMVRLDVGKDAIQLKAQDPEFGWEATEKVACSYTGGDLAIGFNSQYLIDILSHLETEEVQFNLSTPTKAGLVTPSPASEQEEIIMLVMPVRLNA